MSHGTIAGMTESGKTHLAKMALGPIFAKRVRVIVLHKPKEIWPKESCHWQTSDPEEFLAYYERVARYNEKEGASAVAFMELSDSDATKYDIRFHKLFTQGRHDGFRCFFMTQRAASVHPAIRENCSLIYLFNCAVKAGIVWAEEFNDDKLKLTANLPAHHFICKQSRFAPAELWIPVPGNPAKWNRVPCPDSEKGIREILQKKTV